TWASGLPAPQRRRRPPRVPQWKGRPVSATAIQAAYGYCEALLREADKDRFVATLFAPAAVRPALYALYAFNIEIARIRELIHEPMAGEIRLQWWTDAVGGSRAGEAAAHPVASALLSAMTHYGLPVERLTALIGARRFDLDNEPMGTLADLEAYADRASANLIL